jgi:hypothetical protein
MPDTMNPLIRQVLCQWAKGLKMALDSLSDRPFSSPPLSLKENQAI